MNSDMFISSFVTLSANCRLPCAAGLPIYRPSMFTQKQSIIIALLLLIGNIEPNQGPCLQPTLKKLQLIYGLLNARSAANKQH